MKKSILVHLGLGSNLGNRFCFLNQACSQLKSDFLIDFRVSRIFESEPLLKMKQSNYYNIVVSGLTELTPFELLKNCLQIENRLGRVRKERWGSRNIDIDILSYGNEIVKTKKLTIPHPEIENRSFVLLPLLEVSPSWKHPSKGLEIHMLWEKWQKKNSDFPPIPIKKEINPTVHMLVK